MSMETLNLLDWLQHQKRTAEATALDRAQRNQKSIGLNFQHLMASMDGIYFDRYAKSLGSAVIDAAIAAAPAVGRALGVQGAKLPYLADLRKLLHRLEFIIVMGTIYQYTKSQVLQFGDLDKGARDGYKFLFDMSNRAPKIREALVTILTTLENDEASRFVAALKAQVPEEFWKMTWAIKP